MTHHRAYVPRPTHSRSSHERADHDEEPDNADFRPGSLTHDADDDDESAHQPSSSSSSSGVHQRQASPLSLSSSTQSPSSTSTSATSTTATRETEAASPHRQHYLTAASSDVRDDDDLEMRQSSALAAASLHASLPAWAVAALHETLDQPWKVHFSGADPLDDDPDFGRGKDTVPFYDGRLKVCYGEGSMAA